MGLNVNVYRAAGSDDSTMGGISSKHEALCLVNVPGPFAPCERAAPALLIPGPYNSARIVPAVARHTEAGIVWDKAPGWWMFGGNLAASSDGRFGDAVRAITGGQWVDAVKIHDRQE